MAKYIFVERKEEEPKPNTLKWKLLVGLLVLIGVISIVLIMGINNFLPRTQYNDAPTKPQNLTQTTDMVSEVGAGYIFECGKLREATTHDTKKVKQECLNTIGYNK